MKTLLVIGGSGFFGKSILDAYRRGLLQTWSIDSIYIFARNAEMLSSTNPELIDASVRLINGDIGSCESLPYAEYVIHAAASSDASKYLEAPENEKKNIIAGTLNFCKIAKSDFKESKILYVSSGAVYGRTTNELIPFSEEDVFIPLEEVQEEKRHYAAAKRDSESEIILLGKSGISVSIARCFAFIGCYLPRDQHFAIGNFIQNGMNHVPIKIKAQNRVYRSYMYADDLVIWLMTIASAASKQCPIYNVGSSEAFEIRELGRLLSGIYSVNAEYKQPNQDRPDYYIPSITKASNDLGLSCSHSTFDAIRLTDKKINAG